MREVLNSLPAIVLTILCWGAYGPVLHRGQHDLDGSRLKPLICVGIAYFVIAIVVPVVILVVQGQLGGWTMSGISWSLLAGAAGAVGALGIVLAIHAGGRPIFVMPLVFGCAPVVNVFVALYLSANTTLKDQSPVRLAFFFAGILMVSLGAMVVLVFQPKPTPGNHAAVKQNATEDAVTPATKGVDVSDVTEPKSA